MKARTRRRVHRIALACTIAGALWLHAQAGTWLPHLVIACFAAITYVAWKMRGNRTSRGRARAIPGPRLPLEAQRTVVYRCWGHHPHTPWYRRNGVLRLLYVGITNCPLTRFGQHNDSKPWWSDVQHITLEHHAKRTPALAAEQHAIRTEKPLYNVVHARTNSTRAPIKSR